jgi:hypothetical protein
MLPSARHQGHPFRTTATLFLLAGKDTCDVSNVTTIILFVTSVILAIFFVAFTACMASDQFQTLTTDVTGIEYMKEWEENPRTAYEGLMVACGEPFSIYWFLPVSLPRQCESFYQWSPLDDLDAYDPRDPIIKRHLTKIARGLKEKEMELELQAPTTTKNSNTHQHVKEEESGKSSNGAGAIASKEGLRERRR